MNHQHIVTSLNRRAEVASENRIMEEIGRHAAPLFYAVMICAASAILWSITADYRINASEKQRENEIISAKLAACANGETVLLEPGHWLSCNKAKHMVVRK